MKKAKAIALLSGGLDSILAVKLMMDLGLQVIAVNMETPFCHADGEDARHPQIASDKLKVPLRKIRVGQEYMEMVKNPRHGYGKNMKPCIDCRVFLFREAKRIMEEEGAAFVFTGEVLGERPMSQRRDAMNLIERESGLKGRVLRPLSARLLEPTVMEQEGLVDRNRLLDIQGRSRKPQLALARRYQIDYFPGPAGGCLLTDPAFARKLKESIEHGEDSDRHITLLKVGRHFRTPSGAKIIAGRDKGENEELMGLARPDEPKFTAHGQKSTYVLLLGNSGEEDRLLAARVCARYSDAKEAGEVSVRTWLDSPSEFELIRVRPLEESLLSSFRAGG